MSLLTVTTIEGPTLDIVPWCLIAIERPKDRPPNQPGSNVGCSLILSIPETLPGRSARVGVKESRDVVVERWRGAMLGWFTDIAPIFRGMATSVHVPEPAADAAAQRRK